jgi:hypothetical protein
MTEMTNEERLRIIDRGKLTEMIMAHGYQWVVTNTTDILVDMARKKLEEGKKMYIELTPEQKDMAVVSSLQEFMVSLAEGPEDDDTWDMVMNLYCALQYYVTEDVMDEFMNEHPEVAEICEWEIQ